MNIQNSQTNEGQSDSQAPRAASNRYLLIVVIAAVAVVTVMLLRQNMEPPPEQQQQQQAQQQTQDQAAMAQQRMQQAKDQIAHVEQILANDSTNFDAWSALGNLYFDANMPDEAIFHYRKALELQPKDLHVRTDLATMLRSQGKSEDAITILNEVVADDSNFTQAWFNLGVIHTFDLKSPAEAVHAWERFLALDPNSEHAEAIRKELDRMKAEM